MAMNTLTFRGRRFKYRDVAPPHDVLRLLSKIQSFEPDQCWEWIGVKLRGYGQLRYGLGEQTPSMRSAHRFSYWAFIGDLVEGRNIHHVCENKGCVNPHHLQQLTVSDHSMRNRRSVAAGNRRKTECVHGHPFDSTNTAWIRTKNGRWRRRCLECRRSQARARMEKRRHLGPGTLKRTHCKWGHRLTPDNVEWRYGYWQCITCRRKAVSKYMRRKQAEVRAGCTPQAPRTHCKRGHQFTPKTTRLYRGSRQCKICLAEGKRRRAQAIREGRWVVRTKKGRPSLAEMREQEEREANLIDWAEVASWPLAS